MLTVTQHQRLAEIDERCLAHQRYDFSSARGLIWLHSGVFTAVAAPYDSLLCVNSYSTVHTVHVIVDELVPQMGERAPSAVGECLSHHWLPMSNCRLHTRGPGIDQRLQGISTLYIHVQGLCNIRHMLHQTWISVEGSSWIQMEKARWNSLSCITLFCSQIWL